MHRDGAGLRIAPRWKRVSTASRHLHRIARLQACRRARSDSERWILSLSRARNRPTVETPVVRCGRRRGRHTPLCCALRAAALLCCCPRWKRRWRDACLPLDLAAGCCALGREALRRELAGAEDLVAGEGYQIRGSGSPLWVARPASAAERVHGYRWRTRPAPLACATCTRPACAHSGALWWRTRAPHAASGRVLRVRGMLRASAARECADGETKPATESLETLR